MWRRAEGSEGGLSAGCGGQNRFGIPFWLVGEFTTDFRAYFSGWIESDVHCGLTDLDFDPPAVHLAAPRQSCSKAACGFCWAAPIPRLGSPLAALAAQRTAGSQGAASMDSPH